MPDVSTNSRSDLRVAEGKLKDGWTYFVERIPKIGKFRAIVVHAYEDASGGASWPIEDPSLDIDPMYPTYRTIEDAVAGAEGYVDRLSEVGGYPDPDKMSARGFRPALW